MRHRLRFAELLVILVGGVQLSRAERPR